MFGGRQRKGTFALLMVLSRLGGRTLRSSLRTWFGFTLQRSICHFKTLVFSNTGLRLGSPPSRPPWMMWMTPWFPMRLPPRLLPPPLRHHLCLLFCLSCLALSGAHLLHLPSISSGLFVCPVCLCLSVVQFVFGSVCLSVCLPAFLPVLSACCLPAFLPLCLLPVCLSFCLSEWFAFCPPPPFSLSFPPPLGLGPVCPS